MTDAELVTREILIHRAGEIGLEVVGSIRLAGIVDPRDAVAEYLYEKAARLTEHAATYALDALGREP